MQFADRVFWTTTFVIGAFALGAFGMHWLDWRQGLHEAAIADWAWILVQYAVSGAFGGFLLFLSYADGKEVLQGGDDFCKDIRWCNVTFAAVHGCLGGVGGAYAWVFFLILNDKLTSANLDGFVSLKNCVSGVVAGFLGFAFLRTVAKTTENLTNAKEAGARAGSEAARQTVAPLEDKIQESKQETTAQVS